MNIIIPRVNNFDLLRLFFALTVLLVHMCELSSDPNLAFISKFLSSKIAVNGFFVISGFLIFMSYENSSSLREYFSKRFWRIYPAYVLVIFTCAILGALLSQLPMNQYFSIGFIKYLTANLLLLNMLQPTLPGVFLSNPIMASVNGALWTIKIEVMFYCIVPILVYFMRRYNKILVIISVYVASCIYALYFTHLAEVTGKSLYTELAKQLPGQLSYFISGTLLYYFFDIFLKYRQRTLVVGIIVYASSSYNPTLSFMQPISLAILVMYIAFCIPNISIIRKYGDLSYGTYLYHFPIIQTAVSLHLFQIASYLTLISILLCVIVLSFLSWHLWEKHFLQKEFRKNLYYKNLCRSNHSS